MPHSVERFTTNGVSYTYDTPVVAVRLVADGSTQEFEFLLDAEDAFALAARVQHAATEAMIAATENRNNQ